MRRYHETFRLWEYLLFAVVTLAVLCLCVCIGSVRVPLGDTLAFFAAKLTGGALPEGLVSSIMPIRLPRVLCVALMGAALSLAGAAMQGLRTGYVTAQVQPLEGALLLFLPVGDDDACTSALSRAAQAVSAPLTTLLSASGTIFPLLADVEDPVLQRNLAVLSRSCYQLLRASENLGDLSAALRGRLPLSMEKTDLTDFLDDFSQTAGDLCLQAGQELDVELPQAPIFLWADRRQLRRVLLALLSNAIKFTAPGTLLHLTLTRRGKWAYLRLTDGGEGMTPEVLASAFSRYAQPQEQGDPRAGAGFSLPVVQAVIQAHGGTILLQSQKDAGTDVTLTLPVGLPQEQALLRSPRVTVDRSGGFVPELVELSDALPPEAYDVQNFL